MMTNCFTDFLLLYALSVKKGAGLGGVPDRLASLCPVMLTEGAFNHGLTVLQSGGYIEVPGEGNPTEVDVSCAIGLTDKGQAAVKLPLLKRLTGHIAAPLMALEKQFMTSLPPAPDARRIVLAPYAYDTLLRHMEAPDENSPACSFVSLETVPEGIVMHLRKPWEPDGVSESGAEEGDSSPVPASAETDNDSPSLASLVGGAADDEYIPANKLTVTYRDGDGGLADLLSAVHRLVFADERKTRKACLCNGTGTYVLTFSPQEEGIRVSCSPIRFNQKRFRGLTDSGLDYAQCGDDVLLFELLEDDLAAMTAEAYAEVWELLTPEAQAQARELHEKSFLMNNN